MDLKEARAKMEEAFKEAMVDNFVAYIEALIGQDLWENAQIVVLQTEEIRQGDVTSVQFRLSNGQTIEVAVQDVTDKIEAS